MSIHRAIKAILITTCFCLLNSAVFAGSPPLVRAENFIVPPSTGPITHLIVKNQNTTPYQCRIKVKFPTDWAVSPTEIDISLKPDETQKIPMSIDKALDLKSNSYPLEITIISSNGTHVITQNVFAATTPVFKPKIDAKLKDFKPAVPITFQTKERKTTISTGWNKTSFNVAVEVQEEKLIGYKQNSDTPIDALQFAIAPRNTETPNSDNKPAQRYEFLIVNSQGFMAKDKCFLLIKPGDNIALTQKNRNLAPLQLKDAAVAVKHSKGLTIYECSIPLSSIPKIKPVTGRDYLMSFLVHDPDGTGIRDLGDASNLWPCQRNKFAWSNWLGANFNNTPPFDSKIEWGFCTSKY